MDKHLYVLCYRAEALIASQLAPRDFGAYMAVGPKHYSSENVLFFEVDPGLKSNYFDLSQAEKGWRPSPDGTPKRSLYISVYRVLEHIDIESFGNLYLTTRNGKVLELEPASY